MNSEETKMSFVPLAGDHPHAQVMRDQPEIHAPKPSNNFGQFDLCCPSGLACCMSTLLPCAWCCGCTTVREKQEEVVLYFGKYTATLSEPGCYCQNPCGVTNMPIQTSRVAINLLNVKVADAKGNPLVISGVVTYQVVDARKAALDVQHLTSYVENQGSSVMKKVAALYPYESQDGHSLKSRLAILARPSSPPLISLQLSRTHTIAFVAEKIRLQMIQLLQERCDVAGVLINNFELVDLAYAPEIAQAMLIRQQAEALVDARKIIVKGAVDIAHGALDSLEKKGLALTKEQQGALTSNLLVTICGDTKVQPVISLSTTDRRSHNAGQHDERPHFDIS